MLRERRKNKKKHVWHPQTPPLDKAKQYFCQYSFPRRKTKTQAVETAKVFLACSKHPGLPSSSLRLLFFAPWKKRDQTPNRGFGALATAGPQTPSRGACDLSGQLRLILGDGREQPLADHLLLHLENERRPKPGIFGSCPMGITVYMCVLYYIICIYTYICINIYIYI